MSDSSPFRGYTAFMQSGSDGSFTGQPEQQRKQYGVTAQAKNENFLQPGGEFDFGQFLNHGYLGNPVGLSNPNQIHSNFGTYDQPELLYNVQGGNRAPSYEDTLLGSAHQLDYGNIVTGPQGPWSSTYGPDSATSSNLFPGSNMLQSAIGTGMDLEADFDHHWQTDGSLFFPPGWDAAISTDQPNHAPVDPLEPFGPADQAWVTPFLHAETQQLAGGPRVYLPIEDRNTLAQTSASPHESAPATHAANWEMRDNKYFCLHEGCRKPFFKRLGDLERHQNNVHDQTKFFWCRHDECDRGKPFPRKDKRNEHERKVHCIDYTTAENH